jgi:dTDP-4-dehydrorhamnose 3,5-epimerase
LIEQTDIEGCVLFRQAPIHDKRGYFLKPYTEEVDSSAPGIWLNREKVREVFWSKSAKSVARGLHLQMPPFSMSKFVSCVDGWITDYILDLRIDKATYGTCLQFELGEHKNGIAGIVIPPGCAHGFVTNSNTALVLYLQSGIHSAEHDSGVNFNQFLLPKHSSVILSDRDKQLPSLVDSPKLKTSQWEQR